MIVVVGGGLAGLVAALEVGRARPGAPVVVLEASDRAGGKLRLEEVGGHVVDTGAEAMLALRPEAMELVSSLDVTPVTPETTSASVFTRGRMHPVPRATLMGIPARPEDALGILTEDEVDRIRHEQPWPDGPVTEDVSVGAYVGTRLGRAVVDRLVEPLLGGVYAGSADRLSLQATLPQAWASAVAGRSSLPVIPAPPAGAAPRPVFIGLDGGVGRLPALLVAELGRLGIPVECEMPVRSVRRTPDGWEVVAGVAGAERRYAAQGVVVATPAPVAASLLREAAPAASTALGALEMASSAVITLAVDKRALGEVPGSGYLVPPVDGRVVKAATFSARKWGWTDALSEDVVHLRASVGRAGDTSDLDRDDAELVAVAVAELGAAVGRPLPRLVDAHVQRWMDGLPQYTVGHVGRVAAVRAAVAALPGLEVAGAAFDGVGIPAVIASARRAAAGLLAQPGSGAELTGGPAAPGVGHAAYPGLSDPDQ